MGRPSVVLLRAFRAVVWYALQAGLIVAGALRSIDRTVRGLAVVADPPLIEIVAAAEAVRLGRARSWAGFACRIAR